MGQAAPFKSIALVVEDDELQRELLVVLLEECEMGVIQCESAEAALRVLERMGGCITIMFTDVNLAGMLDGVDLAHFARRRFPAMPVIVTSGAARSKRLPDGAKFLPKPWRALDVLREAERAQH
jgi:two-component system, cell cycle response regulator CpdR